MKQKKISIRVCVFAVCSLLITFVAISVCAYTLSSSNRVLIKKFGESRLDVLHQINTQARLLTDSVEVLSNLLYYDENVVTAVYTDKKYSDMDRIEEIQKVVDRYGEAYSEINIPFYAVIAANNGFNFCSDHTKNYQFNAMKNTPWYKKILNSDGQLCWVSSYDDQFFQGEKHYVFSAARMFYDPETNETKGILVVSIGERQLYQLYKDVLGEENNIFILDEAGTVVSSPDQKAVTLNYYNMKKFDSLVSKNGYSIIKKAGEKYLLSNSYDSKTGLFVIEEIPLSFFLKETHQLAIVIILFTSAFILLALILAYYFSQILFVPLQELCEWMDGVQNGNLSLQKSDSWLLEFQQIRVSFNDMVQKIDFLMRDMSEKERARQATNLAFLRAQINPHFIYNTLFSIKCMVEMEQGKKAIQMLDAFLNLLRESINEKNELISVKQEIKYLRSYIDMVQFRYEETIFLHVEHKDNSQNCCLPNLLLQPIVENAVLHGLVRGKTLIIAIHTYRDDNNLSIVISDNGKGFDLNTIDITDKKYRYNGIGIKNVLERMRLLFGEDVQLKIESELENGTTVSIKIPWID